MCLYFLGAGAGFEPTTSGLWARRATRLLYPAIYCFPYGTMFIIAQFLSLVKEKFTFCSNLFYAVCKKIFLQTRKHNFYLDRQRFIWYNNQVQIIPLGPVGQAVKTPPFHGGNTSSILVRVTIFFFYFFSICLCPQFVFHLRTILKIQYKIGVWLSW